MSGRKRKFYRTHEAEFWESSDTDSDVQLDNILTGNEFNYVPRQHQRPVIQQQPNRDDHVHGDRGDDAVEDEQDAENPMEVNHRDELDVEDDQHVDHEDVGDNESGTELHHQEDQELNCKFEIYVRRLNFIII